MPSPAPPVSEAAAEHAAKLLNLQGMAVRAGRRAWAKVDARDIVGSWTSSVATLEPVVTAIQQTAASAGAEYGASALAEQGMYVAPTAWVNPLGFAGVAPDGRDLRTLLYSPGTTALSRIGQGMDPVSALASSRSALDRIVLSVLADTSRQAASVDIVARPKVGYVRMLVGSSCKDCVLLAGRFYRWNAGFKRHPHDDCVHVPTTQKASPGMLTDPYEHFARMSTAEQDAFWGPGNAQAIRDGADIYRVGNAGRRSKGMTTLEGTGKRNRGGGRVGQVSGFGTSAGRGFARGISGGRLTPDGIYATAKTREEALAMLEQYGYILPTGQVPGGSILGSEYQGFGQMGRGGTRRGARDEVLEALRSGERGQGAWATLTAAERRVQTSRLRWEAVQRGVNPFSNDGAGLTPQISATVEKTYRRWLTSNGDVFTK